LGETFVLESAERRLSTLTIRLGKLCNLDQKSILQVVELLAGFIDPA
jgi:hypothetical protein